MVIRTAVTTNRSRGKCPSAVAELAFLVQRGLTILAQARDSDHGRVSIAGRQKANTKYQVLVRVLVLLQLLLLLLLLVLVLLALLLLRRGVGERSVLGRSAPITSTERSSPTPLSNVRQLYRLRRRRCRGVVRLLPLPWMPLPQSRVHPQSRSRVRSSKCARRS